MRWSVCFKRINNLVIIFFTGSEAAITVQFSSLWLVVIALLYSIM